MYNEFLVIYINLLTEVVKVHNLLKVFLLILMLSAASVMADDFLFWPTDNFDIYEWPISISPADLNNDGRIDLAVAAFGIHRILFFEGTASGFADAGYLNLDAFSYPTFVIAADLTGDLLPDLAITKGSSGKVVIYKNLGAFGFQKHDEITVAPLLLASMAAADFDNDNDLDLVVCGGTSSFFSVLTNDGSGAFTSADYDIGENVSSIIAANLNGDSNVDLAATTGLTATVLLGNGDGTFGPPSDFDVIEYATCVIGCDLNGDTFTDLVVSNSTQDSISILFNDGSGTFTGPVNYETRLYDGASILYGADFDNDSDNDIAVATYDSGSVAIFYNDGAANFSTPEYYHINDLALLNSMAVADFNDDGDLDIAVGDFQGNRVCILENQSTIEEAMTSLKVAAYSPVNLWITDPSGRIIGKDSQGLLTQQIDSAEYYEDPDLDLVTIFRPLPGDYDIQVIGEEGAPPGATYSVGIQIDGSAEAIIVQDANVPASGETDSIAYLVDEGYQFMNGDANRDDSVNLLDILYLISYLYDTPPGPAPYPVTAGEGNCDNNLNLLDILYLIDYLYGDPPGLAPCQLNE